MHLRFVQEAVNLVEQFRRDPKHPIVKAIGYKEALDFLTKGPVIIGDLFSQKSYLLSVKCRTFLEIL